MTGDSVQATSLEDRELMLVRIAALVAVDAPALSYMLNLEMAAEIGFDINDVRGVLTAIAPIVGTTRIIAATDKIGEAMELEAEQL